MTEQELIEKYGFEGLAKANFKYFFTRVLKYRWAPHMDEWALLLRQTSRILIECARGHGKTIFFSVAYPLWLVYREIPVDILLISYSEEQVKNNIMNKINEIIMTNDHLIHMRPSTVQLWGAQLKTFANGSKIRGESFGSSVRGAHPDYLNVDDPLKDKGGMTPDEQLQYFLSALMGTVKSNTQVVVDGTPLDNGDLLEQLEKNPAFTFKSYPAENEERTEALFPYLFSLEDLRKIEAEIGSFVYSRERLLKRIDPKSQVFKDRFLTVNDTMEFPDFATVRTIIDPAISEKDNACDSAIVTVGIDHKNEKWELGTELVHADDPGKILEAIVTVATRLNKKYNDYAIVIEGEVFQKVLAYDLRKILLERHLDVRVIEVTHSGNQGKHQRIIGLQPDWEAKNIHLLPESDLAPQFKFYRPGIKGFKIDGLDAFGWIRHESVSTPITDSVLVDEGVPEDAWE